MQASEGGSDQSHGQVTSQKKQHVTEQRLNATEPYSGCRAINSSCLLWLRVSVLKNIVHLFVVLVIF